MKDGYNDISQLIAVNISQDKNGKWYYGEYFKSDTESSIAAIELFGETEIKKEEL